VVGSALAGKVCAALAVLTLSTTYVAADGTESAPAAPSGGDAPIARYFDELEKIGLIDVSTGSEENLRGELGLAESLLRSGAALEAAVALYSIVESPRFRDFGDSVEYQNAEYYLAVALAKAGAYDSALDYLGKVLGRGPTATYFAPAHRRAIDIALETRDYQAVLKRLAQVSGNASLPVEAIGEQRYLKARIAYDAGKLAEAEGELVQLSRKSRLYSSALYLRGLIRTRRGELGAAAEALCEIADTPDTDKFTFVVDDRYFTIKDLARLGLGRLAHEHGDYDDAYYHYFQIPDDSDRLPEALFEAAWSMYQKRELGTARDLTAEMMKDFPDSPLNPEARLLAGYVELADCEFDAAQRRYDRLVAELGPVVAEMDKIRKDRGLRSMLFDRALARWRAEKAAPDERVKTRLDTPADRVMALLRLDPEFVRLHDAVAGIRRAAGEAPHVVGAWRRLSGRMGGTKVAAVSEESSAEAGDAAAAGELSADIERLEEEVARARTELRRGVRARSLGKAEAAEEEARLKKLAQDVAALGEKADEASRTADQALSDKPAPGLRGMVAADLAEAHRLETASDKLAAELGRAADELARRSLDKLYQQTRHVLDKAKLGKIDAVIGQKRRLEIEVEDLAAGRFPKELHGRLWEAGLIGDDEEYWPFEGEFWADEYEGFR
jgi:tetratricopeptide (TPR) repeat protein